MKIKEKLKSGGQEKEGKYNKIDKREIQYKPEKNKMQIKTGNETTNIIYELWNIKRSVKKEYSYEKVNRQNIFYNLKENSNEYNIKNVINVNKNNKNITRNIAHLKFGLMLIKISLLSFFQICLSNNITLTIKGKGNKKIFSTGGRFTNEYFPAMIYINGTIKETVENSHYFTEEENTVILVWNKTINQNSEIFLGCDAISYVNLMHFDNSQLNTMHGMFRGCSSLIWI